MLLHLITADRSPQLTCFIVSGLSVTWKIWSELCFVVFVLQVVGVEESIWLTWLLRLPDDGFPQLLRVSCAVCFVCFVFQIVGVEESVGLHGVCDCLMMAFLGCYEFSVKSVLFVLWSWLRQDSANVASVLGAWWLWVMEGPGSSGTARWLSRTGLRRCFIGDTAGPSAPSCITLLRGVWFVGVRKGKSILNWCNFLRD